MSTPLVSDELWRIVEPLLPKESPKPKGGRPRMPDRACLTGIIFVLKLRHPLGDAAARTGLRHGHDLLAAAARLAGGGCLGPAPSRASETAWVRRTRSTGSRACLDSAQCPGKKGGHATGPDPTNRGKPGTKRHVVVDRRGTPLAPSPDRREPARQHRLRGTDRCHSGHQAPAWSAPQTSREAARGQSV